MQAFDVLQNFNDTLINGDGGPLEIFLRLLHSRTATNIFCAKVNSSLIWGPLVNAGKNGPVFLTLH